MSHVNREAVAARKGLTFAPVEKGEQADFRQAPEPGRLPTTVVEAGGVEPPSEKARNEENYVRIRLMIFDRHL